jgi:protein gp37
MQRSSAVAENSGIEWTHHTHNEWLGCTKVSAGCKHCYAEALMKRYGRFPEGYIAGTPRMLTAEANRRKPFQWDRAAAAVGERHRVFAQSLSDVFDEEVPDAWRVELFARIFLTPNLDWLVLTKRAAKMYEWITHPSTPGLVQAAAFELDPKAAKLRALRDKADWQMPDGLRDSIAEWFLGHVMMWPLRNAWLGVTAEDQASAEERIPYLVRTPAVVRWLSVEPLIGGLRLDRINIEGRVCSVLGPTPFFDRPYVPHAIDWVIVGGESGSTLRAMHPDWARSLRDQCVSAGVAFFFKQWGEWAPEVAGDRCVALDGQNLMNLEAEGSTACNGDGTVRISRVGKHAAGRLLDGREWSEFPRTAVGVRS